MCVWAPAGLAAGANPALVIQFCNRSIGGELGSNGTVEQRMDDRHQAAAEVLRRPALALDLLSTVGIHAVWFEFVEAEPGPRLARPRA